MRRKTRALALALVAIAILGASEGFGSEPSRPGLDHWTVPDLDALADDDRGRSIRLGHDLTVETSALIGPGAKDPAKRFAGNRLTCQNCHLNAGAKRFGLPFVGVYGDFPQYRAREGHIGSLQERVNGCMTRSLNGRPLPEDSPEMQAIVAYIQFLSAGRAQDGRGSGKLPELSRAADPGRGRAVYNQVCVACHGADGQGKLRAGMIQSYEFPPLWGHDSFNDGAGMNRLISAANFIHSNMPNGATWQAPALSDEESWDVAAFIVSRQRPHKADLERDYPNRLEKPVDAAYPPFADGFDAEQHRFGPFEPIRKAIEALRAADAALPPKRN
jgi:thiosulfate dehydrogenase